MRLQYAKDAHSRMGRIRQVDGMGTGTPGASRQWTLYRVATGEEWSCYV